MAKRSAHLTRLYIESLSSFSPYRGANLLYKRSYDPNPLVNIGMISKIDIDRAISILYKRGELSVQEIQMLHYVMLDGRLSRRDISKLIEKELGYYVDQRTVSRRLHNAYMKISKFLGFEYSDSKVYRLIAKKMGKPYPYILSDEEIDKIQQIWERI